MGITGLLPFLKKVQVPVNVEQFHGQTVAIDAYCWLHKGAFACADKLASGEKTNQFVCYCLKFLKMLLSKSVKPIMVFDGCHLPSKKDVEIARREKREMNRKKATQFLREGKSAEARECLQKCIDVTPEMALELMNACRDMGVDCIVAPYEADAQLAYLNQTGMAQVVITEDSDLLPFGCEKVLFKMDISGNGTLIEKCRLNEVMGINEDIYSFDKFRYMCILSGCDYLPSLSGIGLGKACKVFKLARQPDLKQVLKKFPSTYLKMSMTVPLEYVNSFIKANNTFLYQLVFDPVKRKIVPLNPYGSDIEKEELTYAGPYMSDARAFQIALGNINVNTGEKYSDFDPETFKPKALKIHGNMQSIWSVGYEQNILSAKDINSECPNLARKEKDVNCQILRSPKKRKRFVDDCHEIYSNRQFVDMYKDSSYQLSTVQNVSPPPKKSKSEFCVQMFKENTNISEFENELPVNPYNSISVTVPCKNKFAVGQHSPKPRLDINKTKKTKSRFFMDEKDSKNLRQTRLDSQLMSIAECTDGGDFKISIEKGNSMKNCSQLLESAFSWPDLGLMKYSTDPGPGSMVTQFKKVIPQTSILVKDKDLVVGTENYVEKDKEIAPFSQTKTTSYDVDLSCSTYDCSILSSPGNSSQSCNNEIIQKSNEHIQNTNKSHPKIFAPLSNVKVGGEALYWSKKNTPGGKYDSSGGKQQHLHEVFSRFASKRC